MSNPKPNVTGTQIFTSKLRKMIVMNRRAGWVAILVVGVFFVQTHQNPFVWADTPHVTPKNFLWRVESRDNTVYLLGSIHVLQEKNYPLAPSIYNAFNQCGTIMFEVDLGGVILADESTAYVDQGTLYQRGYLENRSFAGSV